VSLRIAVTGANGFVGRHLLRALAGAGHEAVGLVRSGAAAASVSELGAAVWVVPRLEAGALREALAGADAVVHLAQIGAERAGATYEAVNVLGTRAIAEAARSAGVPRAVYLSGLGVARYGQNPRTTDAYFLSKLAAEVELWLSGLEVTVFRPSYLVGSGDVFLPALVAEMASGEVEVAGDGAYRLQPVAVADACEAIVAAAEGRPGRRVAVYDLVGPEPLGFLRFLDRLHRVLLRRGRQLEFSLRQVPVAKADRRAAAEGYHGMLPDEFDCLLCDEIADPAPLEALLGRFLTPLDEALAAALTP
jgi:nucleoside-diphosphate-sugar epimerase